MKKTIWKPDPAKHNKTPPCQTKLCTCLNKLRPARLLTFCNNLCLFLLQQVGWKIIQIMFMVVQKNFADKIYHAQYVKLLFILKVPVLEGFLSKHFYLHFIARYLNLKLSLWKVYEIRSNTHTWAWFNADNLKSLPTRCGGIKILALFTRLTAILWNLSVSSRM